ncbi:glycerol-3-phosphate 1-O-acyltransferase PlsY [Ehrlichia japonica]|uniref:Glycerol-3-phosphate acyltransferase n=1 Tax=Ehrlichia japonica TaxID=391036 RepID=X5H172_9RICK|nr:glycerol-3-phosphate 1-O-acyltransferase PlsY [Ehrlichia japonica]AHX04534.1 acyl-phosphate glycerol 3-phosphate acyltransferase [Ehrlichia japonica]
MSVHIIILVSSYLIGSIPFGLILSYMGGLGDIRKIGSGNIGATNVFRKNKKLAALTLFLDATKGFISVLLASNYSSDQTFVLISVMFSIIGHMFPIWLLFKGGKGISTFLGSMVLIEYRFTICFLLCWIIFFVKFNYSSLSSIISTTFVMLLVYMCYTVNDIIIFFNITLLIITQHTDNIIRIFTRKEGKVDIKPY